MTQIIRPQVGLPKARRSGLHSILTSSQFVGRPKPSNFMVSFKRPQVVSVEVTEVTARTPPPAFLFPNQQCQRPEPPQRPNRLAPGQRRRRRFRDRRSSCQPLFSEISQNPKGEPLRPQKTAGGKLGFPLKPKPTIRLERGNYRNQPRKARSF